MFIILRIIIKFKDEIVKNKDLRYSFITKKTPTKILVTYSFDYHTRNKKLLNREKHDDVTLKLHANAKK